MDAANAPLRPALPSWALPEDHRKNWPMIENGEPSLGLNVLVIDTFSESSGSRAGDCDVVKVEQTESKWEVELDVARFKPENLKVSVVGDLVTISGNQVKVEICEQNPGICVVTQECQYRGDSVESNTSRSFTKRYTLPSGCDPDALSSSLTNSGSNSTFLLHVVASGFSSLPL